MASKNEKRKRYILRIIPLNEMSVILLIISEKFLLSQSMTISGKAKDIFTENR